MYLQPERMPVSMRLVSHTPPTMCPCESRSYVQMTLKCMRSCRSFLQLQLWKTLIPNLQEKTSVTMLANIFGRITTWSRFLPSRLQVVICHWSHYDVYLFVCEQYHLNALIKSPCFGLLLRRHFSNKNIMKCLNFSWRTFKLAWSSEIISMLANTRPVDFGLWKEDSCWEEVLLSMNNIWQGSWVHYISFTHRSILFFHLYIISYGSPSQPSFNHLFLSAAFLLLTQFKVVLPLQILSNFVMKVKMNCYLPCWLYLI